MISIITLDKKGSPIQDFAFERNKLLEEAKSDWVFFVDSDEKVSPELKTEILKRVQDDKVKYNGYYIPRKNYFLGKWLKFGETGNVKLLRLGKKEAGKWKRKVHEYWDIKNTGTLKNPLLHYSHSTINDFLRKLNFYSTIDAAEFKTFNIVAVLIKPVGKFILNYFLRLGFLDGTAGFIMAYLMSFNSLLVRVKQYELNPHP